MWIMNILFRGASFDSGCISTLYGYLSERHGFDSVFTLFGINHKMLMYEFLRNHFIENYLFKLVWLLISIFQIIGTHPVQRSISRSQCSLFYSISFIFPFRFSILFILLMSNFADSMNWRGLARKLVPQPLLQGWERSKKLMKRWIPLSTNEIQFTSIRINKNTICYSVSFII